VAEEQDDQTTMPHSPIKRRTVDEDVVNKAAAAASAWPAAEEKDEQPFQKMSSLAPGEATAAEHARAVPPAPGGLPHHLHGAMFCKIGGMVHSLRQPGDGLANAQFFAGGVP
jgi:hypothetical protein